MKKWLSLLLAVSLLWVTAPFVSPAARAEEQEVTILAYICGSNLESEYGEATEDLKEMMSSGIGNVAGVTVLAATGGSRDWQNYGISSRNVQYYRLGGSRPELLKDAGRVNMGDPDTLSAFLRYGITQAPAKRYILIFWDHGGGPVYGVCNDANFRDDGLTLSELRDGIARGLNGAKADIIALDCCVMNCVDLFADLADLTAYTVASQEMVSGTGLNYDGWMIPLAQDPSRSAEQVATDMARTYVEENAKGFHAETATMSVIASERMPAVVEATDAFCRALYGQLSANLSAVVRLRDQLTSFGEFIDEDATDLVDVAELCDVFSALVPQESAALKQAAEAAVCYNCTTKDITAHAHGMSLFMPLDTVNYEASEILDYFGSLNSDYGKLAVAMTTQSVSSGYVMSASSAVPSNFYAYDEDNGFSGAFCDIWDGYYGDYCDFDDAWNACGGNIWAGLDTFGGSVWDGCDTGSGIWDGYDGGFPDESPWGGDSWVDAAGLWGESGSASGDAGASGLGVEEGGIWGSGASQTGQGTSAGEGSGSGTPGGIWGGLSGAAQTGAGPTARPEAQPTGQTAQTPEQAAQSAEQAAQSAEQAAQSAEQTAQTPEQAAQSAAGAALNNIWAGLLNPGSDYYQPGEENQNVQPGVVGTSGPAEVLAAAGTYFAGSTLTSQTIYSLQVNKEDLNHLMSASGVLSRAEGDELIRLGNLGATTIDWSTGLIFSMFDGSWPMLNGQMVRAEFLYADESGATRFVIPAKVNGVRMYLLGIRAEDGRLEVAGATQGYDENGFAIRGSIPLEEGMVVEPLFIARAEDGTEREYAGELMTVPAEGLELTWEKIPAGSYQYCFALTDLSGQVHDTEAVELTF